MNTSSNPVLGRDTFSGLGMAGAERMTINGFLTKCTVLFILLAGAFSYSWSMANSEAPNNVMGLAIGAMVFGMIISIALSFKPTWSPVGAPVFALVEGFFLGAISAWYDSSAVAGGYDGIVLQAGMATLGTFATMLFVYRTGIIKVTDRFRAIVTTAMMSIFVVYLASFVIGMFGVNMPFLNDASPIGIGISILVIVVASMMLLVDFDMIERGAATGAPKYMEWYGAFALLVTIVWIYVEFLRLLSKLRR